MEHMTILMFDNMLYNQGVDDTLFTTQRMGKRHLMKNRRLGCFFFGTLMIFFLSVLPMVAVAANSSEDIDSEDSFESDMSGFGGQ